MLCMSFPRNLKPSYMAGTQYFSYRDRDRDSVCFNGQDRECPGLVSSPVAGTKTSPRPGPRHRYWPKLSSNPPRTETLSRGTGDRGQVSQAGAFSIDVASTMVRWQLIYILWELIDIYVEKTTNMKPVVITYIIFCISWHWQRIFTGTKLKLSWTENI